MGSSYDCGGSYNCILMELRKETEYTKGRQFHRFSKDEHIVRLHIGLEDPKDLIFDLKNSLNYIK